MRWIFSFIFLALLRINLQSVINLEFLKLIHVFLSHGHQLQNLQLGWYISMAYCKKDVTPVHWQWSYVFHALTHQYVPFFNHYQ